MQIFRRLPAYLDATPTSTTKLSFVCPLPCQPQFVPSISITVACPAASLKRDTPVLGTLTIFLSVTKRGGSLRVVSSLLVTGKASEQRSRAGSQNHCPGSSSRMRQ